MKKLRQFLPQHRQLSLPMIIFHQSYVLLVAFVSAFLYALSASWQFAGDKLFNQYYYVVPIVVPFITFLFNRAERFYQRTFIQLAIDALVVITAMWRARKILSR